MTSTILDTPVGNTYPFPTGIVPKPELGTLTHTSNFDPYNSLTTIGPIVSSIPDVNTFAKQETQVTVKAHSHYFKDVSRLKSIDVYRVLELFSVTDPCLQHAIKKLLVAGGRGAGKSISKDIQEALDSLVRWQSMRVEDNV